MEKRSTYEPAKGVEKVICIIAVLFCVSFFIQALSAQGGLLFYVMPLAIGGIAVCRLFGWIPGGVARGGGGGP